MLSLRNTFYVEEFYMSWHNRQDIHLHIVKKKKKSKGFIIQKKKE